jgi:hypothetical protein
LRLDVSISEGLQHLWPGTPSAVHGGTVSLSGCAEPVPAGPVSGGGTLWVFLVLNCEQAWNKVCVPFDILNSLIELLDRLTKALVARYIEQFVHDLSSVTDQRAFG